jgi:hypothetical protein
MNTEVLVPASGLDLAAPAPYVIQSCVLAPPAPPPGPDPEEAIYAPVPPGVDYASLPVLDTVTQLIDTSPDQIIGCANDLPAGGEQQTLDALFPAAIDGDGVVNRTNNDIWVYDGTTWNNVGPTPGPQVVVTSVLPPWNEIAIYEARIRTRLLAQSLAFALQLLTEPDPFVVRTKLDARSVLLLKPPATDIEITAPVPEVEIFDPSISAVVAPFEYTGTGAEQSITGLFEPGLIFIRAYTSSQDNYVYDLVRGSTKLWSIDDDAGQQTVAESIKSFNSDGFTVGTSNLVNQSGRVYAGHAFRAPGLPVSNSAGTITTSAATGQAYSVVTYTGNGTAGATIGHGLPTAPELVWVKRLSGGFDFARAGGPAVGDNHSLELSSREDRASTTAAVRTTSATTVELGNGSSVNANGSTYVAYSFANVPKISKIATYEGNGDLAGQFIDCGFEVDFAIVKSRNKTASSVRTYWLLFDRSNVTGKRYYELATGAPSELDNTILLFQDKGIRVFGESINTFEDLNQTGVTYLYMAFSYVRPTVLPPAANLEVTAELPAVN